MSELKDEVAQAQVDESTVQVWWLGGTGFIFKTHAGTQIYIDPYLSNSVAGIFGIERDFPTPIEPEDARPDLVIATHFHEDHLDPGTLPALARYSNAVFMCPPTAMSRLLGWGVARDRVQQLQWGQTCEFKDVKIRAVPARHDPNLPGWEVPDALGVIFDFGGLTVYHSGDTEYDLRLRALKQEHLHTAMLVINGTGGNMDAHEAALLAWQLGVSVAMPMHHILWKDYAKDPATTLDPRLFESTYRKLGGAGIVPILEVGQRLILSQ